MMKRIAICVLNIYRNYLSPMKLRCCRFHPSCSEYAVEAIEKYGFIRGCFKGALRLLRCHPFSKGGYDPA